MAIENHAKQYYSAKFGVSDMFCTHIAPCLSSSNALCFRNEGILLLCDPDIL